MFLLRLKRRTQTSLVARGFELLEYARILSHRKLVDILSNLFSALTCRLREDLGLSWRDIYAKKGAPRDVLFWHVKHSAILRKDINI